MDRVVLRKGREKSVLRMHPWIFSGAVASEPSGAAQPTVAVEAADGTLLGYGWRSPQSQIRVRMVSFDPARVPDDAFVRGLIRAAVARRLPQPSGASGVRLVNAESDGLPGVVVDCYAGWAVCQFTSVGADACKRAIADELMGCVPGCRGVAERADADSRIREGLETGGFAPLAGEDFPETVAIAENGVKFLVDVRRGHKTGFYLDQRDARAAVGAMTRAGMDVLNCFCYTGGFGLCAAANGAASVTQVDASGDALALAKENEKLNAFGATRFDYVEADVFKYLRQCRDAARSFDMIVLDPPKFADAKAHAVKAARGYKDINLLAMKLLRPGGILATFSCSGAMQPDFFDRILSEAAIDARRAFQVVGRTGHPADHPVALAFPEGRYLKGAVLRLI